MCGILGIRSFKETDVKTLSYFAMLALQHRGQQSAGITWYYINNLITYSKKSKGLVEKLYSNLDMNSKNISSLVGHTRYSTTGGDLEENIQPFIFNTVLGEISLVHNGNLTNTKEITAKVLSLNLRPKGTTDSELIGLLITDYLKRDRMSNLIDAIKYAVSTCKGAISLIIGTSDAIYGYRDNYGIRPLVIGKFSDKAYILASETTALDAIGANYIQEVQPGTIVHIKNNIVSIVISNNTNSRKCIFEDIYFSRPDSILSGDSNKSIYEYRLELGRQLYKEHPVNVDLIIGTPDSGIPGSIG